MKLLGVRRVDQVVCQHGKPRTDPPKSLQVPVTVHTGPSERSSPSEPHAQTARPPLFMLSLLCSRSSPGVVIGPRLPIERELDPQFIRLRLGRGDARSHVLCIDDGQSTARLHPHAHIVHPSPIGHYSHQLQDTIAIYSRR